MKQSGVGVCKCGTAFEINTVPEYTTQFMGIPLTLLDSATQYICPSCGEKEYFIPDPSGLSAAVAVTLAKTPQKLRGKEITFLRKAINLPAKIFAGDLGVTPETLSRWENDKAPISPSAEKLLRFVVGAELSDKAPAIFFDPKALTQMKVKAICGKTRHMLTFERVKLKLPNTLSPEEKYSDIEVHAA